MKKIISAIAAAAIALSASVTSFASGFTASMETASANKDAIDIIYNGQLMTYKDAVPEIINDRTMLPFRIALENMGAEVNYEDATRLVTASLNGKTITFTLEDSVIYIDDNGQKSQVTLDTPMVIKNDRTLVPIRFISSALGMQIGWDGDTKTVLIVDGDTYMKEFEKSAPNLMSLADKAMPEYNTESVEVAMKLNMEQGDEKMNMSLGLAGDGKKADDVESVSCKLSLDLGDMVEGLEPIKDAAVDAVLANSKIYFKTDLIEQLAKSAKDNATLNFVAEVINGTDWFYIDIEKLFDQMAALSPEMAGMKDVYIKILNGDKSVLKKEDLTNIIKAAMVSNGDATVESAMAADMVIDMYSAMDKYITVTDNSISIKMDKNAFTDMIKSAGAPEEAMKEIEDAMTFDIDVTSTFDEKQAVSKGTISMGLDIEGVKVNLSLDMASTEKVEENVTPIQIPENATDIMTLIP